MIKKIFKPNSCRAKNGFNLAELAITTGIIGILSSIAYPNYLNNNNKAKQSEAEATVQTIPAIIGAYIDATGETPSSWDDLSSIAVVMTNDGPATGSLSSTITLPNSIYDLTVEGPTDSVYTLTATRVSDKNNNNLEGSQYKYAIKSCFDVSNGASDIRTGALVDIENEINCG